MLQQQWQDVRQALRSEIGANDFANWVDSLTCHEVRDGACTLCAPNGFIANYVMVTYGDVILRQMNAFLPQVNRIHIRASARDEGVAAPHEAEVVTPDGTAVAAKGSSFAGTPLDPRFTFESFVVGKPNELAYAAARRIAEGAPETKFNPLFLYGGVGLGKTHLMHAIGQEMRTHQPALNCLYLSAEQFMYSFVQALRDRRMMDFKELFRSVDVLMVDDVQFIAGKNSTQEEFFHTFNVLIEQNKQIIISADRSPGEIKDLEGRIKSRLQSGLIVDLHPTDYELRLGIMQSKVVGYLEQYPRIELAEGVLEFLAQRITTNVRVLEGALTRLFAFAALVSRHITMELARDCLSDILRASEIRASVEVIQRKVAQHYNIRLSDMTGPRRDRTFARPRQVAMYLSKQLTARSLPEIGRRFGGRDHTTVLHAVKRIDGLRSRDPQLSEDLEILRRAVEGRE